MYEYGEACPISKAASVLCERWTLQILRELLLNEFGKTLRTLTEIMLGDLGLQSARDSGALKVTGPTVYTKNLAKWFPVSGFAGNNPRLATAGRR